MCKVPCIQPVCRQFEGEVLASLCANHLRRRAHNRLVMASGQREQQFGRAPTLGSGLLST
jgi:hypothetical protein